MSKKENALSYETASKYFYIEGGTLRSAMSRHMCPIGKEMGTINAGGYIRVTLLGYEYLVHRLIWLLTYKEWPKLSIDHIDRIKTNNRIDNLREADSATQNSNRVDNNKVPGVAKNIHGKWYAYICIEGERTSGKSRNSYSFKRK